MDVTQFDSRASAEDGSKMILKHPVTGNPIATPEGDECFVIVRGLESPSAVKAMSRLLKANSEDKTGDLESKHQRNVKAAKELIIGYGNLERGSTPLKSPDDNEMFLNLQIPNNIPGQLSFAEQINAHCQDRANYLGNVQKP